MNSAVYESMWKALKEGKHWQGDLKNIKKNGEHYWVKAYISPLTDDNGKKIGYTSIRSDITSNKAKEEFMANMSHELRTPLNAIIGFSTMLSDKLTTPKFKDMAKEISKSSKSLLVLINDILDLSKIESANFKLEKHEFNGYEELVGCAGQIEELASKYNLYVQNNFDKSLKAVFLGDWIRVRQIILNLISNAVKFTPENGKVNNTVSYDNGNLVIEVADTGIGMSKEVQDRIFKPFEQADGSTTRKYGGTGLGLSITNNLIHAMNGRIELVSEEGKGSTFTVTIPLEKIKDEEISSDKIIKDEEEWEQLSGHVLVVEDNKTNQMFIKMLLEDFGITSDVANDGVEATKMYDPQKHELILMDENMPNMNGIEAMKALREKYKEKCTPIIALTANAMKGDKEKFLDAGMDDFITKPIDETLLYETLNRYLKK